MRVASPDLIFNFNYSVCDVLHYKLISIINTNRFDLYLCFRSLSTRFLAMVWWHFVVLIIAAYIGGLLALLHSDSYGVSPIHNVQDLAENKNIKFGAVRRGSTLKFFQESSEPMFQQMYTEMVSFPDVLVPYIEAGVERVKTEQGAYAFLTDALSIEYAVMCDPDLVQVGGLLDYKGYGIALPRGMYIYQAFNAWGTSSSSSLTTPNY